MAKTRYKKISDYGISDIEEERTLEYCRCHTSTEELVQIKDASVSANKVIWKEIFISLCSGQSYAKLSVKRTIPYSEVDFYAYRRKALAILAKKLRGKENLNNVSTSNN